MSCGDTMIVEQHGAGRVHLRLLRAKLGDHRHTRIICTPAGQARWSEVRKKGKQHVTQVQRTARWGGTNADAPPEAALAQLREVMDVAEAHDGFSPISDQAFIAASRGERELSRFDAENQNAVAFGVVGEGELDLVVRPDARSRGIGSTVIAELLGESDRTGELRAWAHGENPAATAILERSGFRPVRELLRMTLDPSLLPAAPAEPVAPQDFDGGFHTTFYDPASTMQAADWVRVNAAAFADHPEQGKMTIDDFTLLTREEWFTPEDLILCFTSEGNATEAASALAAYAWVKTLRGSEDEHDVTGTRTSCELYALGVHPDHAGHGLGRALLGTVLDRMAQHRPERVSLYVDGENERAVDLYVRNGFAIEQRSTQWLRG